MQVDVLGVKAAATAVGLGRNTFDRYFKNCSVKKVTLEAEAVTQAEGKLISFILGSEPKQEAASATTKTLSINAVDHKVRNDHCALTRSPSLPLRVLTVLTDCTH